MVCTAFIEETEWTHSWDYVMIELDATVTELDDDRLIILSMADSMRSIDLVVFELYPKSYRDYTL